MFLRLAGPLIALIGIILIVVGMISFFRAFDSFQSPRYFWCVFAGMPLFVVGLVLAKFGYLGAISRYVASESAPVAKDVVNYLGEGTRPGVKAAAKAFGEGVTEGIAESRKEVGEENR
jgi:hypothetical protein